MDPEVRKRLLEEREALGGLETYQAASVHGGDKVNLSLLCASYLLLQNKG